MASSVARFIGVALSVSGLVLAPLSTAIANPNSPAGFGSAATAISVSENAASAVRAEDYPSWDDVNAAKANETQKQAEVSNINSLLLKLSDEAARLTNIALARGEEYLVATYNLEAANHTADALQQRANDAVAAADSLKAQVGAFAAQIYRNGGDSSTVSLLVEGDDADNLLYRLGTMNKLTEQSGGLLGNARVAANNAESLQSQAALAVAARDQLASSAAASLDEAESAQTVATSQLAEQRARSTVLYEQLAALNNTTAEIEKNYAAGVQSAAEAKAREDAARAAEAAGSGTGSSWVPDSGSIASPDEAKNIALGLIGNYGWGNDQYGCLVQLWTGESGWRVNAYNPDSGAYGIPQSWPANKMSSVADDWPTNAYTQITWGLKYIDAAYSSPCNAWAKWNSRSPHWY